VLVALVLASWASLAWAQLDERRVSSPNGQIEFRLFIAPPPDAASLDGIAYQVWVRGKMLLTTSYLGLDIFSQAPFLGEKVGLVTSRTTSEAGSHTLVSEYMQNGSLGRLINVEARVFDDGVAFRYVVPRSIPLEDLYVASEITEFRFAKEVGPRTALTLPFVAEIPGASWVSIAETPHGSYPPMTLLGMGGGKLQTILPKSEKEPWLAFSGHTPITTPWRIVAIGSSREAVEKAGIGKRLQ
jgi:hypothetical protein